MKIPDRISIILASLCLLVAAILAPALIIASSGSYYRYQFDKNGIYGSAVSGINGDITDRAAFTDDQLNAIIGHITDYLFGETDDFALVMDGVTVKGVPKDGVSVFGEEAVAHMTDVKALFSLCRVLLITASALFILSLGYIIFRRKN